MNHFEYRNRQMFCEDVNVANIAEKVGTPFYLYSYATIKRHFRVFDDSFNGIKHLSCYSMKCSSNGAIIKMFAREGGGIDIVSGGELYRALKAGVSPEKTVYSGVGKSREEMEYAIKTGILMFNAESHQEVVRLNNVAGRMGKKAGIAIRVNPDVDPETHPYITTGLKESKFGININSAFDEYLWASKLEHIDVIGVSCHIGSQLTKVSPFVDALKKIKVFINRLRDAGIDIRYLDIGGGLGITYNDEKPPQPDEYASAVKETLGDEGVTLILEPGRVIMGNSGILVTKVLYTKENEGKNFVVVDAAMNDLMRPSLYGSYHEIRSLKMGSGEKIKADVVGPICETGDFFAKERNMDFVEQNDLVALMSAGAYGFSMSSNYNSRPRVAEVLVSGDIYYVVRERETYEDLIRGESIPDFL